MSPASQGRQLPFPTLLEHWDSGVPVAIPIAGIPALQLRIDKTRERLTLRAPLTAAIERPANKLAYINVETLVEQGVRYVEISTTDARLLVDGYAMLMAIADRIQHDGAEPLTAFDETLDVWQSILSTRTRLSPEAEVGLFGELLLVRAFLETGALGGTGWRGGFNEEHDFGFSVADVEVKTTSGEKRRHWVHGLTQLVRTGETPLWVLSVQITRGGHEQGETLPELIDSVLSMVDESERIVVDSNLSQIGWADEQRDLFANSWRLRTTPLALQVDDDFPRLTPGLLARASIDTSPLRQVIYEIDLTDRSPSSDPPALIAAVVDYLKESMPDA